MGQFFIGTWRVWVVKFAEDDLYFTIENPLLGKSTVSISSNAKISVLKAVTEYTYTYIYIYIEIIA